jgi:hypothetical protein
MKCKAFYDVRYTRIIEYASRIIALHNVAFIEKRYSLFLYRVYTNKHGVTDLFFFIFCILYAMFVVECLSNHRKKRSVSTQSHHVTLTSALNEKIDVQNIAKTQQSNCFILLIL